MVLARLNRSRIGSDPMSGIAAILKDSACYFPRNKAGFRAFLRWESVSEFQERKYGQKIRFVGLCGGVFRGSVGVGQAAGGEKRRATALRADTHALQPGIRGRATAN